MIRKDSAKGVHQRFKIKAAHNMKFNKEKRIQNQK